MTESHAETPDKPDPMFPVLDDAQIAQLKSLAKERQTNPGEILFEQGDSDHGVFVVLRGSLEVVNVSNEKEAVIAVLGPGTFTGEVNQLSGRGSLVRGRVREPGTVLELGRTCLRDLMQSDAALGELFLRAFIQRRVQLIASSTGDAVLIGSSHSGDTLRLREFLTRNGHPHTYVDVERDPDVQSVLDRFGI